MPAPNRPPVPILPGGSRPTSPPPKKTPPKTTPKTSPKTSSKSGSSVSAAEKRAVARENDAKKKAGQKYLESAANLELQAKAIRDALNVEFKRGLDQNLGDVSRILEQQMAALKEGHALRAQEFLKSARDTETAVAGEQEQGFNNLVRERADSLSAILEQGAGETDAMRAMLMSARNWHSNVSESNRGYFDTMRSVNAGITDLNIDTKTALANAASSAETERERLWQDYFNKRGEAWTQLGNIKGQQADYYAQAKEMGVKPKKGAESAAEKEMEKAFQASADEAGKSYTQQGLPQWIQEYKGTEQVEARQANSNLAAAMTFEPIKKAEGATLRKWAS